MKYRQYFSPETCEHQPRHVGHCVDCWTGKTIVGRRKVKEDCIDCKGTGEIYISRYGGNFSCHCTHIYSHDPDWKEILKNEGVSPNEI